MSKTWKDTSDREIRVQQSSKDGRMATCPLCMEPYPHAELVPYMGLRICRDCLVDQTSEATVNGVVILDEQSMGLEEDGVWTDNSLAWHVMSKEEALRLVTEQHHHGNYRASRLMTAHVRNNLTCLEGVVTYLDTIK